MEAFFWQPPTAADLANTAYRVGDFQPPSFSGLWPEHDQPFGVFRRNQTQWRVGPGGPIGLDYGVIYRDLDRLKLSDIEHDEVMALLRIIERVALTNIHKS